MVPVKYGISLYVLYIETWSCAQESEVQYFVL